VPQSLYHQDINLVPIKQEARWVPEPVLTFREEKKSLAHTGIQTLNNPACNLVSILMLHQAPTEDEWLQQMAV
jgi:hypothetical protein